MRMSRVPTPLRRATCPFLPTRSPMTPRRRRESSTEHWSPVEQRADVSRPRADLALWLDVPLDSTVRHDVPMAVKWRVDELTTSLRDTGDANPMSTAHALDSGCPVIVSSDPDYARLPALRRVGPGFETCLRAIFMISLPLTSALSTRTGKSRLSVRPMPSIS